MHVGAEADVVREILAVVVGIFVDHDLVGLPEPIVAIAEIIRCDAEIKAAEPETAGASAREMPDVAAAETAGKVAVLPRMIHVVVRIVAAGIVASSVRDSRPSKSNQQNRDFPLLGRASMRFRPRCPRERMSDDPVRITRSPTLSVLIALCTAMFVAMIPIAQSA